MSNVSGLGPTQQAGNTSDNKGTSSTPPVADAATMRKPTLEATTDKGSFRVPTPAEARSAMELVTHESLAALMKSCDGLSPAEIAMSAKVYFDAFPKAGEATMRPTVVLAGATVCALVVFAIASSPLAAIIAFAIGGFGGGIVGQTLQEMAYEGRLLILKDLRKGFDAAIAGAEGTPSAKSAAQEVVADAYSKA